MKLGKEYGLAVTLQLVKNAHILSWPAFRSDVSPLIAHVHSNTEYLTAILVFLQIYIYI